MTTIKLTTNLGGHNTGDEINVTPKTATHLIDGGYAEATEAKPKRQAKTKTDDTEPKGGGAPSADSAKTAG